MIKMLWRKVNPLALLVGMQIDIVTMEKCMETSLKTRNKTTVCVCVCVCVFVCVHVHAHISC